MSLRHGYQRQSCGAAHEQQWAAVDAYSLRASHPSSRPNTKALKDTLVASADAGLPEYQLSPAQGKFLALHCRTAGVTHALELGTLGGYSAIWLASENPQLQLTTIESRQLHVDVARRNIKNAGLADRVEVLHGNGLDVMAQLQSEVKAGLRPPFGFIFIDADKTNNWNYFKLAISMAKHNAVICVANIVREGQLADPHDKDASVIGSREVVEKVGKMPGVDSVVLQTVGEKSYDGWLWAVIE